MQTIGNGSVFDRRLYDVAFFVALLATALALGPALAHVLGLPNKIDLPREQYFIVQSIYRGWWQIAFVLAFELAGMLVFGAYHRERKSKRTKILIPDTAHGTNPASAALWGYKPVPIKSGPTGSSGSSRLVM